MVVVVDTSASQSGEFRQDSLIAAEQVLAGMRAKDRVQVFAADVDANALTSHFGAVNEDQTEAVMNQLGARLPLGNTNLISVLETADKVFKEAGAQTGRGRSLVYIGDATSIESAGDQARFAKLIDSLRAQHVAVHSIAVGPTIDVAMMGVLANQTGGQVGIVNRDEGYTAQAVAKEVTDAALLAPIWVESISTPETMTIVQGDRLPPLRLDRDSILLGMVTGDKQQHIEMNLLGQSLAGQVRVTTDTELEHGHPDFGFLSKLVTQAEENQGLTLPTANSALLRQKALAMAAEASELVRAGKLALQTGDKRGAKAIAEMALEADPQNEDAKSLKVVSGTTLIMQDGDPFADPFAEPAAPAKPAPAADDPFADPFADPAAKPAAPKPAADDPFADPAAPAPAAPKPAAPMPAADDPFAEPAAPAPAAPKPAGNDPFAAPAPAPMPAQPPAVAPPVPPAPAPAAPAPMPLQPPAQGGAPAAGGIGGPAPPTPGVNAGDRYPAINPNRRMVGDDEILSTDGGLLQQEINRRSAMEGAMQGEVRQALIYAERQVRQDPRNVAGQLKGVLARVEAFPDLSPALRQKLSLQLQSAIQASAMAEERFNEQQANRVAEQERARAASLLLQKTYRREATLKTLSQQMNALIDEGRYVEADGEVSVKFVEEAGDTITDDSVAGQHFAYQPLALQTYARDREYRKMRERNFVDAFSLVLKANIPFVDEPHVVLFPEAEAWQRLSRHRLDKYGAFELVGNSEAEKKIEAALSDEISQVFTEIPLTEAIDTISKSHDIPIVIDQRALEEEALDAEMPVSIDLQNVSLRSFLRLMLRDLQLAYVIKDEVMQITTTTEAENNLVTKVYPVGDLVVPIFSGGMGGGMMGGGMGGGMMGGGMGGGMGGMGGGMGGMGGGMGGFGGGGAFMVPDEADLSAKAPAAKPQTLSAEQTAQIRPLKIEVAPGQTRAQAWKKFFAEVEINSPVEMTILDQRVRSTAAMYSRRSAAAEAKGNDQEALEWFVKSRELIGEAIRAGQVQPWMYQAYAIALAATGAPQAEVERALLSAVDFAGSATEVLNVAGRLENIGSSKAALRLCMRASEMSPDRREPYVMGMRLAEALDDAEGIQWACAGVLGQAWPESYQPVVEKAKLLSRSTFREMLEKNQREAAAEFAETLKVASAYDVVVRVSWTGDADVDLAIEEPSGTVCSLDNRSTASGGTILGDSFPGAGQAKDGTISETYMCPKVHALSRRRPLGDINMVACIAYWYERSGVRFLRATSPSKSSRMSVVIPSV